MTRLQHIALVVLLLLGGQMAAAAVAPGACCCPAMAGPDVPPAPCASLSALGCCETKAQTALPDAPLPPAATASPALDVVAVPTAGPAPVPPRVATAAARALRHTILRL